MGFIKSSADSLKLEPGVDLLQQTYDKDSPIADVLVTKLNVFADDQGGWFKENLRTDDAGYVQMFLASGVKFQIRQSNMSYLGAHAKRFWHIHPQKGTHPGQNEIWTTNSTLLLGLIDLRKKSPTLNQHMKIVLSSDKAVYIPAGVAHGFINPNNYPATLVYFADQHFTADATSQEHRIDPQRLSFDFVEPEVM